MQSSFRFSVPFTIKPSKLLEMVLNKKATSFNIKGEKPSDYVLKVCGQDEYLVGDYDLIQYQYIQDCVAREAVPTLVTVALNTVPSKSIFYFLQSLTTIIEVGTRFLVMIG